MSSREVPLQEMHDGRPDDPKNVLSAPKRLGMVGVLAVVAGTAVFFNAEEQAAEASIWDREMAGLRNATALPDQQNRRFVTANGIAWHEAEAKCANLGVTLCPIAQVKKFCRRPQDPPKDNKNQLKPGAKRPTGVGIMRNLCRGTGFGPQPQPTKPKGAIAENGPRLGVCSKEEFQDLKTRWLPAVDGDSSVWLSLETCDVKTVGSSDEAQERGVIGCCKDMGVWQPAGGGGFAQVHPSPVLQAAEKTVAARKDATHHDATGWSKHEYIDKMRNSDPFLAHKQKGTKMKAMHDHVTEKATESLGAEGVAAVSDGFANIHGKITSHISSVVDALKGGNSTQVGRVSGALRTSDPSASYKMTPVSLLAQGDTTAKGVAAAIKVKNMQRAMVASQGEQPGGDGEADPLRVWDGKEGRGPGGAVETRRPMMSGN